jgi:parallel beta-helix repeat protein
LPLRKRIAPAHSRNVEIPVYESNIQLEGEKIGQRTHVIVFVLLLLSVSLFSCSQVARATETIYINADGTVTPSTAPIQRNGDVYKLTGNINSEVDGIIIERNNTVLEGAGHTIQGAEAPTSRGIYLLGSYQVTIQNVKVKNFESGILLDAYSTFNTISGNELEGNEYGISCWAYSDNNSLTGNNVTGNNLVGIWIVGSSDINIIGNIIASNSQYGISLESSLNDIVYHNSLTSNNIQVNIYDSNGTWDNGYPCGGNYWSDYEGVDVQSGPSQNLTGSDGIGDTPYVCDESNVDNYPLMNPLVNLAITNVLSSKTAVGAGYKVYVNVTVQNEGWNQQTTKLTVYLNTTVLATVTNLVMAPSSQVNMNFTWQTTAGARGTYVVRAAVDAVSGEVDTGDNTRNASQTVRVTMAGDVNGDGSVDIYDAIVLAGAFNSYPSSSSWNGNADINSDNAVDIYDAILLANNFGKKT